MAARQAFQSSSALSSSTPNCPQNLLRCQRATPRSQPRLPSAVIRNVTSLSRRTLLTSVLSLPICFQSTYDDYATTYDNLDGLNPLTDYLGLTTLRRRLVARARGRVLETGVGTGLNLPLYDTARVTSITALDNSERMLALARERSKHLSPESEVHLLGASVDDTGLASATFDTVVDTFSLCVYPHPLQALTEMKRLIKRDGRVLLLEHTRSTNALLAAYQDVTAEATAVLSKGCFPNQDVLAMVRSLEFRVLRSELHLGGSVVYLELGI